jgi:colanic acid/amylovoran biosynthesis protein
MKIMLYPHGGSGNHGCEAIVRTTSNIIRSQFKDDKIYLASFNPNQDLDYGIDNVDGFLTLKYIYKYNPVNIVGKLTSLIFNTFSIRDIMSCKEVINEIDSNSLCLSIGGDIYSYRGVIPYQTLAINSYAKKKNAKLVLWGCSISEDCLNKYIIPDIKSYDLIIARESITYNNLIKINPNTKLYPDPAFTLKAEACELPSGFSENNTIGINLSPLIIEHESTADVTLENYRALIKHIIDTTDMQIALIPHVVWSNNDDRIPLRQLYNQFKDTGRVVMIEDQNAMRLKGIISRCRMFIGARTHSTIAAYSSCVPTLVVGYSVKAKGIANDLFGTYDKYVIPVQSLNKTGDLIVAFEWLHKNEDSIRSRLNIVIPEYCQRAWEAGKEVKNLVEGITT